MTKPSAKVVVELLFTFWYNILSPTIRTGVYINWLIKFFSTKDLNDYGKTYLINRNTIHGLVLLVPS